jgi:hypothetical protein
VVDSYDVSNLEKIGKLLFKLTRDLTQAKMAAFKNRGDGLKFFRPKARTIGGNHL